MILTGRAARCDKVLITLWHEAKHSQVRRISELPSKVGYLSSPPIYPIFCFEDHVSRENCTIPELPTVLSSVNKLHNGSHSARAPALQKIY